VALARAVTVGQAHELAVQRRAHDGPEIAVRVAELVRIRRDVVVLVLAVDVLDVERLIQPHRLVRRRVAALRLRVVGVGDVDVGPAVLDQHGAAPAGGTPAFEQDGIEAPPVDRRRHGVPRAV
jgi:hypothetical protein